MQPSTASIQQGQFVAYDFTGDHNAVGNDSCFQPFLNEIIQMLKFLCMDYIIEDNFDFQHGIQDKTNHVKTI